MKDPYAALRIPEFKYFIIARFCIIIALQIQRVAVGYQIYDITGDVFALGLMGLAEAIPSIGVSLVAGHITDMFPRKRIVMYALFVLTFCSILLWGISINMTQTLQDYGVTAIYGVIFLSGIARGFLGPAIFAFMPQLLPHKDLFQNAVSWNSTTWQTASVVGPAVGGLVYGLTSVQTTYALDFGLMIFALMVTLLIKPKPLPIHSEKYTLWESLTLGIKFIFGNSIILSAISLDLFAVLFGGTVALLPAFAKDILKCGPEGLGILQAAPAIGSVGLALAVTYFPMKKAAGLKLLIAVAGFGLCMIGFAISEFFWLSFAILLLSGLFDSVSVIVRSTLLHTFTPEHMKGRVSAVNNVFIGSSNEIGAFESGLAARLIGLVPSVIFGGSMTLLVVGFMAVKAKVLRKLDL
jgi:MFS family permease